MSPSLLNPVDPLDAYVEVFTDRRALVAANKFYKASASLTDLVHRPIEELVLQAYK